MSNPKPWEDFEAYRLHLKLRRLEQEKKIQADWDSLRHSWKENGEWIRKQASALSSGDTEHLIWGPVGRFVIDLVRQKFFHRPRK